MITLKLCSSTNDDTSYIVTQLSKDINAGLLPQQYHVVLDEAYPCLAQEMSQWKGYKLSVEKDAFNYHLSLCCQVIECASGILVQRWGIFWRPLRISMDNHGVAVQAVCWLHSVCVKDLGLKRLHPISQGVVPGFENETDHQRDDHFSACILYTDGTPIVGRGCRTDLENCNIVMSGQQL